MPELRPGLVWIRQGLQAGRVGYYTQMNGSVAWVELIDGEHPKAITTDPSFLHNLDSERARALRDRNPDYAWPKQEGAPYVRNAASPAPH